MITAAVLIVLAVAAYALLLPRTWKREEPKPPAPQHEKEAGLMSCGDLVGETDEVCLPAAVGELG